MHSSASTASSSRPSRAEANPESDPPTTAVADARVVSFVGRQPILDRRGRTMGHELFFRDSAGSTTADFVNPVAATASVLVSTLAGLEADSLLGGLPGFVNADPELEIACHAAALGALPIVFDIPPSTRVDDRTIERVEQLRDAGFEICLDDFDYQDPRSDLLPYARYAKVDFSRHGAARLRKISRAFAEHATHKIAYRVESPKAQRIVEQQEWEFVQGYYFAHPEQVACRKPSIRRSRLFEILSQTDDDTPVEDVANHLRRVPHLTMNVLTMANLVRSDAGQRIESIQQAVVMVGQQRLRRWLYLLLFASDDPNGCADPLCQVSSNRSTIMESLAKAGPKPIDPDRAGLTGMLSLTPALLGLHPKDICEKLSLDYSIEKALLHHKGEIGQLLSLVERREEGDFEGVSQHLDELDLTWGDLENGELAAAQWSNGLTSMDTQSGSAPRLG